MKKILGILAWICVCHCVFSQENIRLSQLYNYQNIIDDLENSKDVKFQEYLKRYEKQISLRPDDVDLRVQKCYFIGNAYLTEDGYNSKYEEFEKCIDTLSKKYPNHLKVLLLKASNAYGDSLAVILNKAVNQILFSQQNWNDSEKYEVYLKRARNNKNLDKNFKARDDYEKAKTYNDSIDNSILGVEIYMALDQKEHAKRELLEKLDYDNNVWELNQKANYLVNLKAYDDAFQTYQRIEEKDSSFINNQNLSKLFIGIGKVEEAREYLLKDTINEWNKAATLDRLNRFDLKHSDGDLTLATYRKLDELSYYNDFFGVKRIQLFFKSPFQPWNLRELSHILMLILSFLLLFIIPYIWILPVQFISDYFHLKPKKEIFPIQWKLKHFWIVSFVYLLADFVSSLLFEYSGFLNYLFSTTLENDPSISKLDIAFMCIMALGTVFVLRKKRYKSLLISKLGILRTISLFFLFIFINYFVIRHLNFSEVADSEPFIFLTAQETIKAVITDYGFSLGFLFVAIIVPIYEEIIFRGVILSSVTSKIGFWKANIFQAVLFSIIHFNFGLFFFYFFFGFYTGLVARSSKGLLVGIIFHAINNAIAIFSIYALMNL
jgi:membrane protease YdiL (CAAX protease family)/tetratricopeptide (TPR) repeat protein